MDGQSDDCQASDKVNVHNFCALHSSSRSTHAQNKIKALGCNFCILPLHITCGGRKEGRDHRGNVAPVGAVKIETVNVALPDMLRSGSLV